MNKLELLEQIDDWLTENNGYALFNVVDYDSSTGQLKCEPLSIDEWTGKTRPAYFEKKEYPTRVTVGILKVIELDKNFIDEMLTAYNRFLKGDWGELDEYPEIVEHNNRYPELATGYYMTSWDEVCIKQDITYTTVFLPFEN